MSDAILGADCRPAETCRDSWHVFEWSPTGDALTCHCGQRTIAVVLKRLTPEDVAHVPVA